MSLMYAKTPQNEDSLGELQKTLKSYDLGRLYRKYYLFFNVSVLLSRNFAEFCQNVTITYWQNHSAVY